MADHGQPDWLKLPSDLLEPIAEKTRDAVTGLTVFRSVCRTWRAAVGQAPRLLLPSPQNSGTPPAGSEYALVFPLSRGWSIVVDARDTSSHLSHLATGATAALPKLNAVRDSATSDITHLRYEHFADQEAPSPDEDSARGYDPDRQHKICIDYLYSFVSFGSYLKFSDIFRFAVHIPHGTPAASTDGMMIMMSHMLQGNTGMVFCRPGDEAWTKLDNPVPVDNDDLGYSSSLPFVDFAYLEEGKMFALDKNGITAVFDAATLDLLHLVDVPPATANPSSKLFCSDAYLDEFDYLHLVALPSKLLLVRTRVKWYGPEGFHVFELRSESDDDGGFAWRRVTGDYIGGNYDLFLDDYHATFSAGSAGRGSRIFYVPYKFTAAYCYSMRDNKLECVYRPPGDCDCEYSTKPSWFVP